MLEKLKGKKTVIFNVIMLLVLIAEAVPLIWQEVYTLPTWVLPAAATVMVIGNLVLRVFFTDGPVSWRQ